MRLHAQGTARRVPRSVLGKLTSTPIADRETRGDYIIHLPSSDAGAFHDDWSGYAGLLSHEHCHELADLPLPTIDGLPGLDYLADGDVVLLLPSGTVNVLYRKSSAHNTILVTERCNSFCLMCSQPPRDIDDSHRVDEILRLVDLVDPATREIGLSGGEPTLLGDRFLAIIEKFRLRLPWIALHVLTNGRTFKKRPFARRLAEIGHPDLMLGIPLYADNDADHDYVVQARGAFDETVEGLYNLARYGVRIEIRVVLHALTVPRLPQLAEFLYRNFPFASHVALMGLEPFGFANRNFEELWADPTDYRSELEAATLALAMRGMNVSIYNHQLCVIPRSVWPFARKSISDWKNIYVEECNGCGVREFCGGFFHSATKRHSAHIQPLPAPSPAAANLLRFFSGSTPDSDPGESPEAAVSACS